MAGRKRKQGDRYPSGKLKPKQNEYKDIPTPETMLHRLVSIATKPASAIYSAVYSEFERYKQSGIKINVIDIAIRQGWSNGICGKVRDAESGYLLGRLKSRGDITKEQHDAGVYFGKLLRQRASMAETPSPFPKSIMAVESGRVNRADIDPEKWREINDKVSDIEFSIVRLPRGLRTLRLLRDVATVNSVDYDLPKPRIAYVDMLREGLDIVYERM